MSYPNFNHISRADRHQALVGVRWRRVSGHELTWHARKALGLTSDRYGKNETAQGVMPDGRPVKLVRATDRADGGTRMGMMMRRIQILCDQCNKWIPMGRILQHEGTGTCFRNRGRGRVTRDPAREPRKVKKASESLKKMQQEMARIYRELGEHHTMTRHLQLGKRLDTLSRRMTILASEIRREAKR